MNDIGQVVALSVDPADLNLSDLTAERIMWNYFQAQCAQGRTPTGAELDRVAKTNNYGRRVLRRWRAEGRMIERRQPVWEGLE
jgi:hypothetical protein